MFEFFRNSYYSLIIDFASFFPKKNAKKDNPIPAAKK
jgi:hypothetical protein